RVHAHVLRRVEQGLRRRAAIAAEAAVAQAGWEAADRVERAAPRHGGDDPRGRCYLADAADVALRDVEVARLIEGDPLGGGETGGDGGPAIAAEALDAVAGHGDDR